MVNKNKTQFIITILFCVLLFINNSNAQSIYKGLGVDNSAFLFGSNLARKTQCIYKPSDFNSMPNIGEIIKIYYRYGTTGISNSHDLSPFSIKMGQTADTIFPSDSLFFTGLTLVRWDSIFTIPGGVQGDWFGIDLQTPFIFDSSKTLIVETQFYNNTAINFGTLGSSNLTQKLVSSDTAAVYQTGVGSTTWQDFGFDYIVTTGLKTALTSNDIVVFPNPSKDQFQLSNINLIENGRLYISDLCGKVVYSKNINEQQSTELINISDLNRGVYYIKIESENTHIIKKIVKL
jgi:hypothetical protein